MHAHMYAHPLSLTFHTQAKRELGDKFEIHVYLSTVSALGDVTAGYSSNLCTQMFACRQRR